VKLLKDILQPLPPSPFLFLRLKRHAPCRGELRCLFLSLERKWLCASTEAEGWNVKEHENYVRISSQGLRDESTRWRVLPV